MKSSDTIGEIAKALCKLQTEIHDVAKDSQAHKYKYADLGAVLQLVRPVMAANGLSACQMPCSEGDMVGVTTRLMHTSGEWLESTVMMGVSANAGMSLAQAAGSVITYARRYSLAAAIGITQVDDDGQVTAPKKAAPPAQLATDNQKAQLLDFGHTVFMSPRRASWLAKHMNDVTEAQADTIIGECKALEEAA